MRGAVGPGLPGRLWPGGGHRHHGQGRVSTAIQVLFASHGDVLCKSNTELKGVGV